MDAVRASDDDKQLDDDNQKAAMATIQRERRNVAISMLAHVLGYEPHELATMFRVTESRAVDIIAESATDDVVCVCESTGRRVTFSRANVPMPESL